MLLKCFSNIHVLNYAVFHIFLGGGGEVIKCAYTPVLYQQVGLLNSLLSNIIFRVCMNG